MPVQIDNQLEIINNLAAAIVRRGLKVPAIFLLEAHRPLQNIIVNSVIFSGPIWMAFFGRENYEKSIHVLREPKALELLIEKLEQCEFDAIPKSPK